MEGALSKDSHASELRLLLGDDHALMRLGLRKLLEEQRHWRVVAEAGDGRTAVRQALHLRPDVVILDIGMPLLTGIEATRQIMRRDPEANVLILSMHADEVYVTRAVMAGARGYLLKDSAGADLIEAVNAVAHGKSYFSPQVARVLVDDYVRRLRDKGIADRYDLLSEREREIFQLVAEARSSKEIAALLSLSTATVETHRANIMQKLDLHSTSQVVLYAVRRGVVS